jgi:hypothetical protein
MIIADVPQRVIAALDQWYIKNEIHFEVIKTNLLYDKLMVMELEQIKFELLEDSENGIFATQWLLSDMSDNLDTEKLIVSMVAVTLLHS